MLSLLSNLAVSGCGLLLIAFPLVKTIALASEINNDTRTQMSRWIADHIPASSSILVEARYAPRLTATPHKKDRVDVRESHVAFQLSKLQRSTFDYLLITSFSYDRYFTQAGTNPNLRRIYSQIFSKLELEKEFSPQFGSYGFHNPTVRFYRIGKNAKKLGLGQ